MLTFPPPLSRLSLYVNLNLRKLLDADILTIFVWLRQYVNLIFHKPLNADILAIVVLA